MAVPVIPLDSKSVLTQAKPKMLKNTKAGRRREPTLTKYC